MRVFDIMASLAGLLLLGPLLLGVALLVKFTSPGPVLYRARRVGRHGALFTMYKFRTMRVGEGPKITAGEADPRITPVGAWLRKLKVDELPQLLNVLCGQMSVVGPRPEDPSLLSHYTAEELHVLAVRPGLTAPVQLAYRELAERGMRAGEDPTAYYLREVLHPRLAMDLAYVRGRTFRGDLRLIGRTLLHIADVDRRRARTR